jgi:hypothetical protein
MGGIIPGLFFLIFSEFRIPGKRIGLADLYDISDDWIPISVVG